MSSKTPVYQFGVVWLLWQLMLLQVMLTPAVPVQELSASAAPETVLKLPLIRSRVPVLCALPKWQRSQVAPPVAATPAPLAMAVTCAWCAPALSSGSGPLPSG